MKNRRKSRELAIQILYSLNKNEKDIGDIFKDPFFEKTPDSYREYCLVLVNGVRKYASAFDSIISELSVNWDLKRITALDNIILRIALFEMIYQEDVPPAVAINEAIDLAKKYSTTKSGRFINGILDSFNKTKLEKAKSSASIEK